VSFLERWSSILELMLAPNDVLRPYLPECNSHFGLSRASDLVYLSVSRASNAAQYISHEPSISLTSTVIRAFHKLIRS
jgi:hypothetical protein